MTEEEFEKQTLNNLITDLKDIDKYTSFKNGAFIYDLGKYQGTLLVNYINNLEEKLNKANEILNKGCFEYDNCPDSVINEIIELKEILGDDENVK